MIGLAVLAPAVWLYNRLVAGRNLARQGYADIDVQLKRRADLVPQLVEAVRAAPKIVERFAHERDLGERLQHLVLLQENYPALKADANFRDLSAKLVEVEDHLQYARRFYNGAVKQYVTRIESFPDNLMAALFRFKPMPFFETAERGAVRVVL
ncbi:MAG: LemA family protein [Betaproteobacteria bacterium]|nr:MAG: LemA family protein [Betaproteobacteria bacterium]